MDNMVRTSRREVMLQDLPLELGTKFPHLRLPSSLPWRNHEDVMMVYFLAVTQPERVYRRNSPTMTTPRAYLVGTLLVFAMMATTVVSRAQVDFIVNDSIIDVVKRKPLNWFAGISFSHSNPQGAFRDSLTKIGVDPPGLGFGVHAGYYFDPIPVSIVLNADYLIYSVDRKRYRNWSDTTEYETQSNAIPFNVAIRLQPNFESWIFPYAEAIIGGSVFNGSYERRTYNGERDYDVSSTQRDVSWELQYGAGAGVMVKVVDIIDLPNTLERVLIDVRMRYLSSSSISVTSYQLVGTGSTYRAVNTTVKNPSSVLFTVGIVAMF